MKPGSVFFCALTRLCQKKAKDVVVLNLKIFSAFTDYMIICSRYIREASSAISAGIREFLKKAAIKPLGVEGESQWPMDFT